jgi:hypothetical protein
MTINAAVPFVHPLQALRFLHVVILNSSSLETHHTCEKPSGGAGLSLKQILQANELSLRAG